MPDDGWGAFTATADAPSAPPVVGQPQTSDGWDAFSAPAVTAPPVAAPVKSGYLANTAAGVVEGGAGVLNTLADPVGNLMGKPLATVGVAAHDFLAPYLGYSKFTPQQRNDLLGDEDTPQIGARLVDATGQLLGAPATADVQAATTGEGVVRKAAAAATGMAALGGGTGVLRNAVINPALGVSGSLTGQAAASLVPEQYKGVAELAGNVGGMLVPEAAGAAVRPLVSGPRVAPLLESSGAPIIGSDRQPLQASAGQARAAGEQLQAAATDPAAVSAALDTAPPASIPNDQPTTAQATGDPGLLAAEYTASRTGTPQQQAAFRAQADAQNDTRVGVLRDQAADADPVAADTALKQHAAQADAVSAGQLAQTEAVARDQVAQTDSTGQGQVAQLQQAADQARGAVGGDLPPGSEGDIGASLRAPVDAANQAAKARESALWKAVDPDGTLAADMTPVKQGAASILGEMSSNAEPLAGKEAGIFETASNLPDVQSFRDLAALRGRVTDAIRQERGPQGDPQAVRRMSMLLDHVNTAMSGAAKDADLPAVAAASSASVAAPNVGGEVFTPSGQRVGVNYELADAGNLTTSHNADMTPNPDFPQELQPRQRDRAASEMQVWNIANKLQPERLGASSTVSDGAPIVGPDGLVESGNGRVLALRRAYNANGPQAQSYRDWLTGQGHDISGMSQPVLIRRRTTAMTPEQRVAFTGEGSTPTTLAMSSTERAAGDAKKLSDNVLQSLQPGDVTDPANQGFVRNFARNVIEPGQEGSFAAADGTLSKEGAGRVQAALIHKAYGDDGLTAALTETTDPTARVLAGAMRDAAGPMARLRAGIEAGAVDPAYNLAPGLVEATRIVQRARTKGISLSDAVAQLDAFSQVSPLATAVLHAAYGENLVGQMSRARMGEALADFARVAEQKGVAADMFGDNVTAQQLLESVSSRNGTNPTAQAGDAASAVSTGVGRSAGQYGGEARGSGPAAAGQEAPGGGSGQPSGRILPQAPPLTANFDAAAQARYAAARKATVDRNSGFDGAPGIKSLLQGGSTSGSFKVPDASVAASVIRTGPAGADHVAAYLAKGGSAEALSDAAAFSLRRDAMRADGTLDPAKYAKWAKDRDSFLSALPDARDRFGAAADAQRAADAGSAGAAQALKTAAAAAEQTINEASAARASQTKAMQASAIGKFLGDADPVARVWSVLNDKTLGQASARALAQAVKSDPAATAGLQRAAAEAIERNLIGTARGATSEEAALKNDMFQRFMRHAEPALREIMTPEQLEGLKGVAASLARDTRSAQVGVGSPTAQLTAGRQGGVIKQVGKTVFAMASGATIGGAIGTWIGAKVGIGPSAGSFIGGNIGLAVSKVIQSAREAGVQNVANLRTEALLNPTLYKLLTATVTSANQSSLLGGIATQLKRVSLVSGSAVARNVGRAAVISASEPPRNALLH